MKEYLPVNWVDGMKINKTHFIAQFNASTYQQAQGLSAMITDINYGLIPNNIADNAVKIYISADNQQYINVRVLHCSAITKGGYVISFDHDSSLNDSSLNIRIPQLNTPLSDISETDKEYFVVISVSPYERVPGGNINIEEVPPRLPYTLPKYELHLLPFGDIHAGSLGPFLLPIGKVKIVDGNLTLQEDYIPPCAVVNSHPLLREMHAEWTVFLGKMELVSLQIIQKIIAKKQQNDLSIPVQKICENMLAHLASVYDSFKSVSSCQPPLQMITVLAGLARMINNSFDIFLGSVKEELLKYIDETCGIEPADYARTTADLCNIKYDHFDIAASIQKVNSFIQLTDHLFTSLLSLEYIGKRKEAGIFVKEQIIASDRVSKYGSFLADE